MCGKRLLAPCIGSHAGKDSVRQFGGRKDGGCKSPSKCQNRFRPSHRIKNTGSEDVVFIEVQTGDYFGEDDIERLEDDFGRA